jgi:DNA-binding transcriptional LysR family regulator
MGPFYALDLLKAAAVVAPRIVLTFDTVSRPVDLENNLGEGVVDIAIDWLPVELDPFINRKLFDDRLAVLARGGHPLVNGGATLEDLLKTEFVGPHRRREIDRLPQALREFYQLGLNEVVRVSELLEIPTVVASTDLLGIFPSSMGPLMAKRLGLQSLAIPIELPSLPIYMIWHETRRHDPAHRWLREFVAHELGRFNQH